MLRSPLVQSSFSLPQASKFWDQVGPSHQVHLLQDFIIFIICPNVISVVKGLTLPFTWVVAPCFDIELVYWNRKTSFSRRFLQYDKHRLLVKTFIWHLKISRKYNNNTHLMQCFTGQSCVDEWAESRLGIRCLCCRWFPATEARESEWFCKQHSEKTVQQPYLIPESNKKRKSLDLIVFLIPNKGWKLVQTQTHQAVFKKHFMLNKFLVPQFDQL